jgi:L-cysteine S-thiosulfotransferase
VSGRATTRRTLAWAALVLLGVGCAGSRPPAPDYRGIPRWSSRAIPEARGEFRTAPDGKRTAVRYAGWTTRDFDRFPTYAYGDQRPDPPVQRVTMPAGVAGDAQKGRALFMNRSKGPCYACHLVPGDDVWPAGSAGPDQSTLGDRKLPDQYLYQVVWDARAVFPNTVMPPWGTAGIFSAEEIVHIVAYLQTLKGPVPPEKDPNRNPFTRARPAGFGDNLDPTNNPALLLADDAEAVWAARGPSGKACGDCHEGGVGRAMRGVATRYPKFVKTYGRVMSLEDFFTMHAPETTGRELRSESSDSLTMSVLIKRASNGMPVSIDLDSPEARAALARGKTTFHRKVGERNHSCADCHTPDAAAGKFLSGRLLADVRTGLTRHFPTWRTDRAEIWDMRKRFQWCMTPLGMNMLAADSIEYAELELYLTSFDNGKPLSVPGIRH